MSRDTIFPENALILQHTVFPQDQHVVRLQAPECARHAQPGMFVHIRCDAGIPMRRPISIMRSQADAGWIEILYKVIGPGLQALSSHQPGDSISILGPIGTGFRPTAERNRALLIGGGVGIPPLIFLAEKLAADAAGDWQPVGLFGSEIPFPFDLVEAADRLPGIPAQAGTALELLENIDVPSRLASQAGFSGCFEGYVTELAAAWLGALDQPDLGRVMIFSCGPTPMLQAVHALAQQFGLPDQICVEEFMACGVGGCAGCTTLVHTDTGPAMRRVCVDGPVFDGSTLGFLRHRD